jgi:hypothetical protein
VTVGALPSVVLWLECDLTASAGWAGDSIRPAARNHVLSATIAV